MKKMSIQIRRIAIQNYKGIDELELHFPPPICQRSRELGTAKSIYHGNPF